MFYFDPMYFVFALPGLALALWAQFMVRSTFARYAKVPTSSGITGAGVAELFMERTGLRFGVARIPGMLTDNYNPGNKTLNLSQSSVQNSVASVAVVAHEFGHALQDAQNYMPLRLRGAIVPAVNLGAWVGPLLFFIGLFFNHYDLAVAGLVAFAATAVFAIVTLPVELNASNRAMQLLASNGVLAGEELVGARKVLNAAAFTYVAAVAQSLLTLLYYVSILGGRRQN
ncbi:MAG: zinc metallopeptidase [Candidatus Eremiobacteraeota bacterium]|nr:zinc metallopeptidase [Candidatus Eremiobacteraeota bacterium]MBV8667935.1 zinc metallopeptidase [Candidatus Eremiobacteraeota bacterium]